MPIQAVFAVVFFAMLFVAFVVLPSIVKRRHDEDARES